MLSMRTKILTACPAGSRGSVMVLLCGNVDTIAKPAGQGTHVRLFVASTGVKLMSGLHCGVLGSHSMT